MNHTAMAPMAAFIHMVRPTKRLLRRRRRPGRGLGYLASHVATSRPARTLRTTLIFMYPAVASCVRYPAAAAHVAISYWVAFRG